MVPNAKAVKAAWAARCTADLEKANASYQAAQRKFLSNTEALFALPSRVDQLRSHAPPFPASLIGHHPSFPSATLTLLEDLMEPEQRQPYRRLVASSTGVCVNDASERWHCHLVNHVPSKCVSMHRQSMYMPLSMLPLNLIWLASAYSCQGTSFVHVSATSVCVLLLLTNLCIYFHPENESQLCSSLSLGKIN